MGKIKRIAALMVGAAVGSEVARRGVRAVRNLFDPHTKRAQDNLVGRVCQITTGEVTPTAGQAIYDDGAGDLILQVRCAAPGHGLTRDMDALIVAYDPATNVYEVEAI